MLLPFLSTQGCETGILQWLWRKTKLWSKLETQAPCNIGLNRVSQTHTLVPRNKYMWCNSVIKIFCNITLFFEICWYIFNFLALDKDDGPFDIKMNFQKKCASHSKFMLLDRSIIEVYLRVWLWQSNLSFPWFTSLPHANTLTPPQGSQKSHSITASDWSPKSHHLCQVQVQREVFLGIFP